MSGVRRQDLENLSDLQSLGSPERVLAAVESLGGGGGDAKGGAQEGIRFDGDEGGGAAEVGLAGRVEDAAEGASGSHDFAAPRFRKTVEVDPGGTKLDWFIGVVEEQDHLSVEEISMEFLTEDLEVDPATVELLQGAGHVPVVDEERPLGFRDQIRGDGMMDGQDPTGRLVEVRQGMEQGDRGGSGPSHA